MENFSDIMSTGMDMAAVSMSRVAQWPSHRAPSVGIELVYMAAVSMSRVAQWPSHRVPSVGIRLPLELAVVSPSMEASSRLRLPRSLEMKLMEMRMAAVSGSWMAK